MTPTKILKKSNEVVALAQRDCPNHMPRTLAFFVGIVVFSVTASLSFAASKNFKPYFASLKPDKVNVRVGPGQNYPIDWVYLKPGTPLEVIASFDVWKKVRDSEGTGGWVHQTMLSPKRHALVYFSELLLYKKPDVTSPPLARLQKGVLVKLKKCSGDWCQVTVEDFKGWLKREGLWGLYPEEEVN